MSGTALFELYTYLMLGFVFSKDFENILITSGANWNPLFSGRTKGTGSMAPKNEYIVKVGAGPATAYVRI